MRKKNDEKRQRFPAGRWMEMFIATAVLIGTAVSHPLGKPSWIRNAMAQEEISRPDSEKKKAKNVMGLQEALEIALKNNFDILSAREAIHGAESERKSALTDFFPKLSVSGNYNYLSETPTVFQPASPAVPVFSNPENPIPFVDPSLPVGFVPGSLERITVIGERETWEIRGTVTQPIFTGLALLNKYRQARLGVESAKTSLAIEEQDISLRVLNAYFNVLRTIELKNVADQAVKLLESQRLVSQELFNAGMIAKNDLLATEVRLAEKIRDQVIAKNTIELRKDEFNAVLQRPVQTPVELDNILTYTRVPFDLKDAIKLAQRNRLELKELTLRVDSSERQVRIAGSTSLPQVALTYNLFRAEGVSYRALDDGWTVEAAATWRFWEWGKSLHDVSAAQSQVTRDRYARMQILDRVAQEAKRAYLELQTSEQNFYVARKAIGQAEENFRTNQERYKQQMATILDVLDAQTLLTQSQTDYYNALYDYNIAMGTLRWAIGLEVWEPRPEGITIPSISGSTTPPFSR